MGLGGQAGVTERLDNYPGFPDGIGGAELADRFVRQAQRYGVEMLQALSVTGIRQEGLHGLEVDTATGAHYDARAVLIATGSTYRRTNAPGEGDLIGAGIHFCATCDGPFYKGSEQLMVVGGGNSGLEEGLFLTQFTDKVTVLEHGTQLKGSRILQDKVMNHPRMEVLLHHDVKEFRKDDGSGRLGAVLVEDRESGATTEHHPAGVFVFIGFDPNSVVPEGHREARSVRLRDDGTRLVRDERARGVRGRRRSAGLHEAAGVRGGGGRRGCRSRSEATSIAWTRVRKRRVRSDGAG